MNVNLCRAFFDFMFHKACPQLTTVAERVRDRMERRRGGRGKWRQSPENISPTGVIRPQF